MGSALSKLKGPAHPAMPAFVGLAPPMGHMEWADAGQAGFLGVTHAPFKPSGSGRADMVLNGISYSGPSTFVAGSATSFNGTIVGRYLKSCVLLRLTGPGGTFDTYPVGGGFPNELPFGQPVVGLDPGQWTFRVFDCGGGLAGEVSFLVQ